MTDACNDDEAHSWSKWRLFTDISKKNHDSVLLRIGNKIPPNLIAYATNTIETYPNVAASGYEENKRSTSGKFVVIPIKTSKPVQ